MEIIAFVPKGATSARSILRSNDHNTTVVQTHILWGAPCD